MNFQQTPEPFLTQYKKEKIMGNDDMKKDVELVKAVQKGITETGEIVTEIGDRLLDCVNLLRTEQSERVFMALSEEIKNLNQLMDFIREVRKGVEHLRLKGYDISMEPFVCWDNSLDVFREMLSAFESRDWVTLSDLIQYELPPLFEEGKKGLFEIKERLQEI
ncbi:hypothetical protein MNBD_NITROSPIRAE03-721 [hydrothermal vent metagenome]|uniref:Uncharacterized protein n=1 Tax=hydrothermal vent metagenome TaxID=652676 RepID=A0A3B1CNV8_9ZZZZ